jgi:hypothetical protein
MKTAAPKFLLQSYIFPLKKRKYGKGGRANEIGTASNSAEKKGSPSEGAQCLQMRTQVS